MDANIEWKNNTKAQLFHFIQWLKYKAINKNLDLIDFESFTHFQTICSIKME